MTRGDERERYLIITSDAHGARRRPTTSRTSKRGGHDEFDSWLAGVVMPWVDVDDTTNWDNDRPRRQHGRRRRER